MKISLLRAYVVVSAVGVLLLSGTATDLTVAHQPSTAADLSLAEDPGWD